MKIRGVGEPDGPEVESKVTKAIPERDTRQCEVGEGENVRTKWVAINAASICGIDDVGP